MKVITFKANKKKMTDPASVKHVLCYPLDDTLYNLYNVTEGEIYGNDLMSLKVTVECFNAIDTIAKRLSMTKSELIRKTWIYMRSNNKYVPNHKVDMNELKEKICAGLILYDEEEIVKAPELNVDKVPRIGKKMGECYKIMKTISSKYHLSPKNVKRKALWLMT